MAKLSLAATLLLGGAVALAPGLAGATANQRTAQKAWNDSDKCAKQAALKYPDYTAEELAKRDAFLRRCLNGLGLPGRAPAPPKAGE
jgi:hypothetical protein